MSFEKIIGNDKVKELLNKNVKSQNLLHSYMFIGPNGIGKNMMAHDFAKMILCMSVFLMVLIYHNSVQLT